MASYCWAVSLRLETWGCGELRYLASLSEIEEVTVAVSGWAHGSPGAREASVVAAAAAWRREGVVSRPGWELRAFGNRIEALLVGFSRYTH